MSKKTIDGVPRELLELAIKQLVFYGRELVASELRALLDAPVKLDLVECDACPTSGGCVSVCMKAPAASAQPQGEPVAWQYMAHPTWDVGAWPTEWTDCTKEAHDDYVRAPMIADWEYRTRKLYAEQSAPVASIELGKKEVGNYGSLYDGPGVRRAYTYKHQPGNDAAYSIGIAAQATGLGGDAIDKGLKLLCELERAGYGVFAI